MFGIDRSQAGLFMVVAYFYSPFRSGATQSVSEKQWECRGECVIMHARAYG